VAGSGSEEWRTAEVLARERLWCARFLSGGESWNEYAPGGLNYRQMEDAENQALRGFVA